MPRFVVMEVDDRPAHEPDRACEGCGRRGTFARITRTDPFGQWRYCRRCWPAAHRRALEAQRAATLDWFAASRIAAEEYIGGKRKSADVRGPGGEIATWHWSLVPGTLWREYRYRLRRSDLQSGRR